MEIWYGCRAHHAVGVGVAGLWDGQTLDDFRGHPGERSHHRHVSGVTEELGRTKVTNLKSQQWQRWRKPIPPTSIPPVPEFTFLYIRIKTQTFRTLSAVMTTVGQKTASKYGHASVYTERCFTINQRGWRTKPLRDLRSLWMTLTGASAWR